MRNTRVFLKAFCLTAGIGILGAAAPGFAQTTEEVVVTGRHGPTADNVKTLTQSVSYADLDLSTDAGKQELRHRVNLTARYLCSELGESMTPASAVPSCREAAVKDAMSRVGTLEAQAAPRGTSWVAGPAWKAPYPAAWTKTYPLEKSQ